MHTELEIEEKKTETKVMTASWYRRNNPDGPQIIRLQKAKNKTLMPGPNKIRYKLANDLPKGRYP